MSRTKSSQSVFMPMSYLGWMGQFKEDRIIILTIINSLIDDMSTIVNNFSAPDYIAHMESSVGKHDPLTSCAKYFSNLRSLYSVMTAEDKAQYYNRDMFDLLVRVSTNLSFVPAIDYPRVFGMNRMRESIASSFEDYSADYPETFYDGKIVSYTIASIVKFVLQDLRSRLFGYVFDWNVVQVTLSKMASEEK